MRRIAALTWAVWMGVSLASATLQGQSMREMREAPWPRPAVRRHWASPREHEAYEAFFREHNFNRMLELAQAFLRDYPRSEFRNRAYLAEAVAFENLGDAYGKKAPAPAAKAYADAEKASVLAVEADPADVDPRADLSALVILDSYFPYVYSNSLGGTEAGKRLLVKALAGAEMGLGLIRKFKWPSEDFDEVTSWRKVFRSTIEFAKRQNGDYDAALAALKVGPDRAFGLEASPTVSEASVQNRASTSVRPNPNNQAVASGSNAASSSAANSSNRCYYCGHPDRLAEAWLSYSPGEARAAWARRSRGFLGGRLAAAKLPSGSWTSPLTTGSVHDEDDWKSDVRHTWPWPIDLRQREMKQPQIAKAERLLAGGADSEEASEAKNLLVKLIVSDPWDYPRAYLLLGEASMLTGDYGVAARAFWAYLYMRPEYPEGGEDLVVSRWKEAIQEAEANGIIMDRAFLSFPDYDKVWSEYRDEQSLRPLQGAVYMSMVTLPTGAPAGQVEEDGELLPGWSAGTAQYYVVSGREVRVLLVGGYYVDSKWEAESKNISFRTEDEWDYPLVKDRQVWNCAGAVYDCTWAWATVPGYTFVQPLPNCELLDPGSSVFSPTETCSAVMELTPRGIWSKAVVRNQQVGTSTVGVSWNWHDGPLSGSPDAPRIPPRGDNP